MMSFLASCLREEYENRWEPTEDSHVLQSANKLFLRIQSSLKRCARFISKGEPLYLLARAFQVQQHPFLTLSRICARHLRVCWDLIRVN